MLTIKDRQKIRKSLPYGTLKSIAVHADVNPVNVTQWFKGLFNSERIENSALALYRKCVAQEKRKRALLLGD